VQYRLLGKSDIEISAVCMGCWAIVGDSTWGPQDQGDAINAIHTSLDVGVTFFDTANMYGEGYSEELLAKALDKRRQDAVIATKVHSGSLQTDALRQECERSLRRLRTDYIDLYQIHWPNWSVPLEESIGTLEALKSEGKIREYGVSNFGKQDITEAVEKGAVVTDQLCYSLLWRAIEYEIQPVCVAKGIGILCYSPIAQGLLTGKFRSPEDVPEGRARTRHYSKKRNGVRHGEDGCEGETFAAIDRIRHISETAGRPMAEVSLSWLLAQSAVSCVIAGARNAKQARANAKAADLHLPAEILEQLAEATNCVKAKLGANPDMWQSESRIR